jgi:hypothetical protein
MSFMARTSLSATAALGLTLGLLGAATLTPATAAPLLSGGGNNLTITYGPDRGQTVVGGAHAAIQGGGDNTAYSATPGGQAREGRVGALVGGQQDKRVLYLDGLPQAWADTPADVDERGHRG